jgi:hypothetical protein
MNNEKRGLSKNQVQKIRKHLRNLDGKPESAVARIGRIASYPPGLNGNARRYRFGISLVLLSIFLLQLGLMAPDQDWGWIFKGFAFLTIVVAAWQIDLAKKR